MISNGFVRKTSAVIGAFALATSLSAVLAETQAKPAAPPARPMAPKSVAAGESAATPALREHRK